MRWRVPKEKPGKGYQGFSFSTASDISLEEDLKRRDFTINAMAENENGEIVDPYSGRQDLDRKCIRHVSQAFAEDPVRILRAARFAARFGFSIADETVDLMKQMVADGEADALVAERVWQETQAALMTGSPQTYFAELRQCGALAVVFPEIDALFGVPQKAQWHPEVDTGVHTMMVLQQAARLSQDLEVRFAALTHDLGKALTPENEWPSHRRHEHRGLTPIKQLCERLRVPKQIKSMALLVGKFHLFPHKAFELKPATINKLLENCNAYKNEERWQQFLLACEADTRGRQGFEDCEYPNFDYLQDCFAAARAVDTEDIVAKYSGPAISKQISRRRAAAIARIKQAQEIN